MEKELSKSRETGTRPQKTALVQRSKRSQPTWLMRSSSCPSVFQEPTPVIVLLPLIATRNGEGHRDCPMTESIRRCNAADGDGDEDCVGVDDGSCDHLVTIAIITIRT